MPTIEVLGSGCPSCKRLFDQATLVAGELDSSIRVEYSTDIQKVLDLGVMQTPVLTVDGVPVIVGTVPSPSVIKQKIVNALQK